MRNYLLSQDLWDVVIQTSAPNALPNNPEEWIRKNAAALYAIQSSCRKDIYDTINDISTANESWDFLKQMHDEHNKIYSAGTLEDYERTELMMNMLKDIIQNGDCGALNNFLTRFPDPADWLIFSGGLTVLHVASTGDHLKIVKKLLMIVSEDYLEKQDENGDTALSLAAFNGKMEIAKCLVEKKDKSLTIQNNDKKIPLVVACFYKQKDMATYLYSVTPFDFLLPEKSNQGIMYLKYSILNGMIDVGVDLYLRCPRLAASQESITLLDLSVQKSLFLSTTLMHSSSRLFYDGLEVGKLPSPSASDQDLHRQKGINFVGALGIDSWITLTLLLLIIPVTLGTLGLKCIIMPLLLLIIPATLEALKFKSWYLMTLIIPVALGFHVVFKLKEIYKIKLAHVYARTVLRYWCRAISTCRDATQLVESGAISAIFQAIENGIKEVVVDILEENPDLILSNKKLSHEILVTVIKYRRKDILRFIYKLNAGKKAFHSFKQDKDGNTLLHLVAKSPDLLLDDDQNLIGSSPAWKLSRQLTWFQEFKRVLPSWYEQVKNLDGETPLQIFYKQHENLRKEAEEWAKKTAESYSIIATLIVTIMFTAVITVPGGNKQDTGHPIFEHINFFVAYMICDVVSLFTSSISMFAFLSILASSFDLKQFDTHLPLHMMIAIIALNIAVLAMILAFSFAGTLMLCEDMQVLAGVILPLSYISVFFLYFWQFPTLYAVYKMKSESRFLV